MFFHAGLETDLVAVGTQGLAGRFDQEKEPELVAAGVKGGGWKGREGRLPNPNESESQVVVPDRRAAEAAIGTTHVAQSVVPTAAP